MKFRVCLAALLVAALACGEEPASPHAGARLELGRDTFTGFVGDTARMSATLYDANGSVVDTGRIWWEYSETDVRDRRSAYAQIPWGTRGDDATITVNGIWDTWVVARSGSYKDSILVRPLVSDVTLSSISAGASATCGVTTAQDLLCWGATDLPYMSYGMYAPRRVPGSTQPISVAVGHGVSCALDPVGAVYCWGDGTLGDGRTEYHIPSRPVPVAGGQRFAKLVTGYAHACGLTKDGTAYCWGSDTIGQVGDGPEHAFCHDTEPCSPTPSPVAGDLRFRDIEAGNHFTCAVTFDDAVYCWGSSHYYQLGSTPPEKCSGTACARSPYRMPFSGDFVSLAAGQYHACGLTPEGEGLCWGYGRGGDLGSGSTVTVEQPVPIAGGHRFKELHAYCGLTLAGETYCWGMAGADQNGPTPPTTCYIPEQRRVIYCHIEPVPVAQGLRFEHLAVGRFHRCGITEAGDTYCWGDNASGRLGLGDNRIRRTPFPRPVAGAASDFEKGASP